MIKNIIYYLAFVLIALVLEYRNRQVLAEIKELDIPNRKRWITAYRIVILFSRVLNCFAIIAGIIGFIKEGGDFQFAWLSIDIILKIFFYTIVSFGVIGPITVFLLWIIKKK